MSKKKQAKAKPAKLPRKIAGVRITKDLRKTVEPLLRLAGHPLVSDTLAAGLLAGADALAAKQKGARRAGSGTAAGLAIGATSKGKERSPLELVLAIAAGEIATRLVAAFDAPSGGARGTERSGARRPATKAKRSPAKKRRSGTADRKK